jgi:hypothetical protein
MTGLGDLPVQRVGDAIAFGQFLAAAQPGVRESDIDVSSRIAYSVSTGTFTGGRPRMRGIAAKILILAQRYEICVGGHLGETIRAAFRALEARTQATRPS